MPDALEPASGAPPPPPTWAARAAVTGAFFLNGVLFSSFFARLPAVKEDLGLSEGELGLALLGAPVGLLVAQPLVGALVARRGSRPVTVGSALAYCAALVTLSVAWDLPSLAGALLLTGMTNGAFDVSMNLQGLTVERHAGRPLFASLHAAFSFGALTGAAAGGLLAAAGVPLVAHLTGVAGLAAAVILAGRRFLLPAGADARPDGPLFARPTRALAGFAAIAFCALLAEGSVNDWSAVHLRESLDASPGLAAAGLTVFSLTMGFGRLFGDPLAARLGAVRLARLGALAAATGLAAAVLAAGPGVAVAGYALMGAGLATLFPLALRAAASGPDQASGPALAAVSSAGYVGFLAGPPVVGLLAEGLSLRAALAVVAALCLLAAVLAGRLGSGAPAIGRG